MCVCVCECHRERRSNLGYLALPVHERIVTQRFPSTSPNAQQMAVCFNYYYYFVGCCSHSLSLPLDLAHQVHTYTFNRHTVYLYTLSIAHALSSKRGDTWAHHVAHNQQAAFLDRYNTLFFRRSVTVTVPTPSEGVVSFPVSIAQRHLAYQKRLFITRTEPGGSFDHSHISDTRIVRFNLVT